MRLSLELAGLAALALAACLGAGAARAEQCAGIGGQVQPRSHIPMFIYAGTADNDAKSHFERFRSLIGGKLSMLAEETRLDFLPDFGLYLPGGQPLPDTVQRQADRDRYWDKTNALQLLRGTVWPGQPYSVESAIYIGGLRGSLPHTEVRVRLPIQPEEVPTTNDSHSAVTFFALAMEARRLKCDPAVSIHLLGKARSVIKDIRRRSGSLVGHLAELEAAVEAELKK